MASLPTAGSFSARKRRRKRQGKPSNRPLVPSAHSLPSRRDDGAEIRIGSPHPPSDSSSSPPMPRRDCTNLYVHADTYRCASRSLCVPCAYKVGTFDVSLDSGFTGEVPNERPERCPRFGSVATVRNGGNDDDGVVGYHRGMSVLTVGDGDLSFSLAIARIILTHAKDGRKDDCLPRSKLVATSYESRDCLLAVYPGIESTIRELEDLGATICYEVDATKLAEALPDSILYNRGQMKSKGAKNNKPDIKFHRIVWNFPCSAVSSGQDGQNDAMETNKCLIREFVRNATDDLLSVDGGEIHMTHKTKPPFNQWRMESVALEGLKSRNDSDETNASDEERPIFEYKGRIVFDRCILPPYTPRKALDKKSFTCHDACIYVFGWGELKDITTCEFPPTIPLQRSHSSSVGGTWGSTTDAMIMPVTKDMVLELRSKHLLKAANPKKGRKRRRCEMKRPI